jgi:nitroreductase
MNVNDALKARKSVRAYLDKPVSQAQIESILEAAACSPSGTNTQPWRVVVLTGNAKQQMQEALEGAFRSGQKQAMEVTYYPLTWQSPYIDRRRACGLQMYGTLDIKREDKQRQQDQWAANYRAFDAPVMMLFYIDKVMETGSYMDYGMFLQSIMLAAEGEGLATCPQASLAEYPDVVKGLLHSSDDERLICGMALGYEDKSALVNSYRTPREPVSAFTTFYSESLSHSD